VCFVIIPDYGEIDLAEELCSVTTFSSNGEADDKIIFNITYNPEKEVDFRALQNAVFPSKYSKKEPITCHIAYAFGWEKPTEYDAKLVSFDQQFTSSDVSECHLKWQFKRT
jgi:hypothetical protein